MYRIAPSFYQPRFCHSRTWLPRSITDVSSCFYWCSVAITSTEVHVGKTNEHIGKPSLERLCKWMKNKALKGIRTVALIRLMPLSILHHVVALKVNSRVHVSNPREVSNGTRRTTVAEQAHSWHGKVWIAGRSLCLESCECLHHLKIGYAHEMTHIMTPGLACCVSLRNTSTKGNDKSANVAPTRLGRR